MKTVADMEPAESGIISGFNDSLIENKLLEMGLLPGTAVLFNYKAPLGDPVCITVSGLDLSLRLSEAAAINILN